MDDATHTDWGQWNWDDTGPGRFHAIVGAGPAILAGPSGITAGFAVRLACARVRPLPARTQHDPPRDQCCAECLRLTDLRDGLARDRGADDFTTTDITIPKELVPA